MDIGALGDDAGDMAGRLRLPMPSTYNGSPSEWSWDFKAYISMFETSAIGVLDRVEGRAEPIQDEDLAITLDTGDPDVEASRKAVTFSRKLHYLLASLTTDTARLIDCGLPRSLHCQMPQGMSHF